MVFSRIEAALKRGCNGLALRTLINLGCFCSIASGYAKYVPITSFSNRNSLLSALTWVRMNEIELTFGLSCSKSKHLYLLFIGQITLRSPQVPRISPLRAYLFFIVLDWGYSRGGAYTREAYKI